MKIILSELDKENENIILKSYEDLKKKYFDTKLEISSCLVCKSKLFQNIGPSIIRLANRQLYVTEENLLLKKCDECGHVTTSYTYSPEYYFEYLNRFYGVVPSSVTPKMLEKASLRKNILEKNAKIQKVKINQILEISSYDGVTLNYLDQQLNKSFFKKKCNVFGIEPTTSAVVFSEKNFSNLKGRILNSTAEQVDYFKYKKKFDAVISSEALRMVSNPEKLIKNIKQKLNKNCIFIVHEGTFMNTVLTSNQEHQYFRQFSQQKINYFTLQGLNYFMKKNGFEDSQLDIHDSASLQAVIQTFIYTGTKKEDYSLLKLSKSISDSCLNIWLNLQSDTDKFYKYLKNVG